jgi:hypothetical protein
MLPRDLAHNLGGGFFCTHGIVFFSESSRTDAPSSSPSVGAVSGARGSGGAAALAAITVPEPPAPAASSLSSYVHSLSGSCDGALGRCDIRHVIPTPTPIKAFATAPRDSRYVALRLDKEDHIGVYDLQVSFSFI